MRLLLFLGTIFALSLAAVLILESLLKPEPKQTVDKVIPTQRGAFDPTLRGRSRFVSTDTRRFRLLDSGRDRSLWAESTSSTACSDARDGLSECPVHGVALEEDTIPAYFG